MRTIPHHRTRGDAACITHAVLTSISQNVFFETNDTLTGKKSSGCPAILNSMDPKILNGKSNGFIYEKTFLSK